MTDWKDISTAPRDGTAVLLAGGVDGEADYARNEAEVALTKAPTRAMWVGQGWLMGWNEAGYAGLFYRDPTHWQPLPPAPTVLESE